MTQNTLPETIGVDYFRHNLEKIFDEIINNGKTYILNKKGKGSVTLLATKTKTSIKTKNELLIEALDKHKDKRRTNHIPQTNREFYDEYMEDYTKRKLTRWIAK